MRNIGKEEQELPQIEVLTSLTGDFLPDDPECYDEPEDMDGGELLDGTDLAQYEVAISMMVKKENEIGIKEGICNLMDYFHGTKGIREKVESAVVSVKNVDGVLYGCTTLRLNEFLEASELTELFEYITGQYSDGWGEGFEQREIAVDGGTLYVHFYQNRDFYLQEQVSEAKPGESMNAAVLARPKLQLLGHDGNIFSIMADARRLLKQNGQAKAAEEMIRRVENSGDYYGALGIISEYVETELSVPPDQKESADKKTKGRGESR